MVFKVLLVLVVRSSVLCCVMLYRITEIYQRFVDICEIYIFCTESTPIEHIQKMSFHNLCTVETGYNDIGLCDALSTALDILWYQLIPHC
jgi:hypothetical protein